MVAEADIPLFDCHVHIFPDAVARKAIPYLAERSGISPSYDGTLNGLKEAMQRAGIDAALNCPIATKPDQVRSINDWTASIHGPPVFSLGTVHPDFPDLEKELRRIADLGLPGIKLHPEYQEFRLDDSRLTPVWRTCSDLGLVILIHAGADIAFQPPYHSAPADFAALSRAWPDLALIAAHFGSWKMWDAVKRDLIGSAVYIDLSFLFGLWSDDEILRMIRDHGAERVLFGTDAPWRNQVEEAAHFRELPLTEHERRLIGWENAVRILRLEQMH